MSGVDISTIAFSAQQKISLPDLMYNLASLSELFDLGLALGSELELEEVRSHILTHMRRAMRARGACMLLYYKAQERFVPVASQGEKLPCGTLAAQIDGHDVEQFSGRGPGSTLSTVQVEDTRILLVSLTCRDAFVGLVALPLVDTDSLLDERGLLLAYMGEVAAQILHNNDVRANELRAAVVQERKRIARDLHDGVVQQLAYALYKLEFVQHMLATGSMQQVKDELERIPVILNESLEDLRATTISLLPSQLSTQTFSEALASLLRDYQLDNPTLFLQQEIAPLPPMPAALEATIFRVIQEALNNVRKHAMATRILLRIQLQPDALLLEIRDNGRGFNTQYVRSMLHPRRSGAKLLHNGLRGMYERVQEAGGSWHIASEQGAGTTIRVTLPLLHSGSELTQREHEVLQLVVAGLDNHAIARKLAIRSETVKKHVQRITQKLHLKDRSQVAVATATMPEATHLSHPEAHS
ncbi:MAG: hypothetical protein PVS3B1_06550 [Ktedonobacteraceae bacterium]